MTLCFPPSQISLLFFRILGRLVNNITFASNTFRYNIGVLFVLWFQIINCINFELTFCKFNYENIFLYHYLILYCFKYNMGFYVIIFYPMMQKSSFQVFANLSCLFCIDDKVVFCGNLQVLFGLRKLVKNGNIK